jgi:two-component system, LuxR family, sensor kinase FixL
MDLFEEMENRKTSSFSPSDIILEHLLDAVLIVDEVGNILYANNAATKLFNKPAAALFDENFGFPVTPFEVQEMQIMRQGELLTVQMLASIISWNQRQAYLLSLRDITRQKQVENELDVERKKLEISSLENEQYASLASHDLKEPIRKILLYSDRLQHEIPADKGSLVLITHAKKIHEAALRMQALMGGIADFSRIQRHSLVYTPTDLSKVVKDVCNDLELVIQEKQVMINCDHLPVIDGVPVQMHQIFLNFLSNAIKYSRDAVPPIINIKCIELDENKIQVTISDNGIGFEPKFAKKIFQPFSRLHTTHYDGSGIGLAICKKIVEAHSGSIMATSVPGEGSTFTINLPKQQVIT